MQGIPSSMIPLIDKYMRETGQFRDNERAVNDLRTDSHNDHPCAKEAKPGKKEYVTGSFVSLADTSIWTIPVWLENETNRGSNLKGVLGRKATVKKAVWRALGEHWRIWGPAGDRVRAGQSRVPGTVLPTIRVIRLGGRGLDQGGLWRSVKNVEDCLAILMGCDDGWTAWKESFSVDQEPGPLWGCRIEMKLPPSIPTDGKEQ